MLKRITFLTLFLAMILMLPKISDAQIVRATGNATESSSQLIYIYDQSNEGANDDDTYIQITNTNDTQAVWIHVQVFRSFDPDGPEDPNVSPTICDERNFVDFLTPNDTHLYELPAVNFPKNMGETEGDHGELTTLDLSDTKGFIIITPVVSEADLSAISFQHLIGSSKNDDFGYKINAMGRDAVDTATGEILADGTVLDGISSAFVLLQPEELFFDFAGDNADVGTQDSPIDVIGIAFNDSYGPAGLLGYAVTPADATWTTFIFDFKEDPTSCGVRPIGCFSTLGLNENNDQNNIDLSDSNDLLCGGTETPEYADGNAIANLDYLYWGWTKIFVSGIAENENHLGAVASSELSGAKWMFTNKDEVESNVVQAPTGISTRSSSQLIYYYDQEDDDSLLQITNTNDTEGVWVHVQIFRNEDTDTAVPGPEVVCDERDFVDFLTPNDTHIWDLDDELFHKNIGEDGVTPGAQTTIDVEDVTAGFVLVTPVNSESDLSAISFQHLIGTTIEDDLSGLLNAMGRDAVDFSTGEILPDGTILDGVSGGFTVIQPEEILFDFAGDNSGNFVDLIGYAFKDNYGPAGLLGYNVLPGDVTWTSFMFDFRENPTSCGTKPVNCYIDLGLNENFDQDNTGVFDDLLCAGIETPEYDPIAGDPGGDFDPVYDFFGWTRIFVSGLEELENHIALFSNTEWAGLDYTFVRGERVTGGAPPENCGVAGDEDGDMLADCADPDCDGMMGPNGETCEATEASCADGQDNDGDGAVDGADTDCDGSEDCPTCESGDQCSDGEDNDGDGNSDCADGGCDGATGPNGETCEAGVELTCNDNQDNDGDGTADCDDPDCAIATNCIAGEGGGGGGCSVAATASPSMLNFLLPLIVVGLVLGIRRRR